MLLQRLQDRHEIARSWISRRAEHALHTFRGAFDLDAELLEADGRVDVVSQQCLAGGQVACQEFIDGFGEQRTAEACIAAGARLYVTSVNGGRASDWINLRPLP